MDISNIFDIRIRGKKGYSSRTVKEPHLKVHYRMRIPTIRSWIVQVTSKDLIIKYHTEGSACRIENVRLDRLKSGLNMDKIEDDIEEDREGRLKD